MDDNIISVETNMFDQREIHRNCTVEILTNSKTGEVSIGWWENGREPMGYLGEEEEDYD